MHSRLAGWGEQQDTSGCDLRRSAQDPEKGRLAGARRSDQHREPGGSQLLEPRDLLLSCASLFVILGRPKQIPKRSCPVGGDSMTFAAFDSLEDLPLDCVLRQGITIELQRRLVVLKRPSLEGGNQVSVSQHGKKVAIHRTRRDDREVPHTQYGIPLR